MTLSAAKKIADDVVNKLRPCSERIMIVGSIRRQAREITDIDVVVIPRRDHKTDMFGQPAEEVVVDEFLHTVNSWTKIRGEGTGKYTQRLLPEMMKLELNIARPENFANLVLIRTGDADFTQKMMIRARKLGFEQRDGLLYDGDKVVELIDESDYFRVLNLPFIIPEKRDKNAFQK